MPVTSRVDLRAWAGRVNGVRPWVLAYLALACCHGHGTGSTIEPLGLAATARLRAVGALKDGCPVSASELVRIRFTHHTPTGADARGQLVVHRAVAAEVRDVLDELYAQGFVIEQARPIEDYGGDDDQSVAANNTSAFNCRAKTPSLLPDGTPAPTEFSIHSYGTAIDLNPRTNPYFKPLQLPAWREYLAAHPGAPLPSAFTAFCREDPARCKVLPPTGVEYLDRERVAPGLLRAGDPAVTAFTRRGWTWGGDWPASAEDKVRTDTQHFEKKLGPSAVEGPASPAARLPV